MQCRAAYREGAWALGATRWQTIWRVTLPAAKSGVLTAVMLGVGRAIGETMMVMMVTGNAPVMALTPGSLFSPARTMTATIAAEMGEVANGSTHYHVLVLHRHRAVPDLTGREHCGFVSCLPCQETCGKNIVISMNNILRNRHLSTTDWIHHHYIDGRRHRHSHRGNCRLHSDQGTACHLMAIPDRISHTMACVKAGSILPSSARFI